MDRQWLHTEVSKCVYCGFCEAVCPTLHAGGHRGHGPRGRLRVIKSLLEDEKPTAQAMESIYTCLLCGACNLQCPVGIKIAEAIREARPLALEATRKPGLRLALNPSLKHRGE